MTLITARLELVPATAATIRAELEDPPALAAMLRAHIPEDWPPAEMADALGWFLTRAEAHPEAAGWLSWYALLRAGNDADRELAGSAGFRGPPGLYGRVEIGYSVIPKFQGQGLATEMTGALADWALAQPGVEVVVAHVTEDNAASRAVLSKLGFRETGERDEEGHLRYERRRT